MGWKRTAATREVVNCPDATPTPAAATVRRVKRVLLRFIDRSSLDFVERGRLLAAVTTAAAVASLVELLRG
jgi:hypothetical protein